MPKVQSDIGLIAQTIKAGFDLWKTFIATRQEAYNRKMDIRMRKAIDAAEKYILADNQYEGASTDKEKSTLRKVKASWRERFFKYNN